MRFLIISDMHGDAQHINLLDENFSKADAVLFAGDFAQFGKEQTGKPALELLCKKHDTIYSVLGNCDPPSFAKELDEKDINIQGQLVFANGLCFAGSGGGSKFTGTTPFEREDSELLGDLDCTKTVVQKGSSNNLILICHNPIYDTLTDKVSPALHVGSPLLRQFIDEYQPLLVVCGHIHESPAIDKIKNTTIVNPGALLEGHYAEATIEKQDGSFVVSQCKLY